jgi:ADP-ribosylglycohydrolase
MDSVERDRLKGMFFGLVVGDALGTTLEFKDRDTYEHITDMVGGGPFNLQPGEWTDDTSMALALAQTLIDHPMDGWKINKIELLKNFTRWYKHGAFSHRDHCFDIGTTTAQAITKFIKSQGTDDDPASDDPFSSGNGAIMRLAPVVVWAYSHPPSTGYEDHPDPPRDYAMFLAHEQSETTHKSAECLRIARIMARNLTWLVRGNRIKNITLPGVPIPQTRDEIKSTGYVTDTWQASWWSALQTDNFRDALLLAVNLGDDADTVGAVTGQVAGAMYGYDAIPTEWLDVLAWKPRLEEIFNQLCGDTDETLHD